MQNINIDKNVSIEFTPDQIGIIFAVLKKQQYDQVADLINSIHGQIVKQMTNDRPKELTSENGIQAST
jgi:hypothetical protein